MQRTLNFTGRKKIDSKDIIVELVPGKDGIPSFNVEFRFNPSDYEPDALLFVEAWYKNTLQRFSFGTVKNIIYPDDRRLSELDLSGQISFRVKMINNNDRLAKIIGSADRIKALGEGEEDLRSSLLPVNSHNLGESVWKVHLDPDDKPMLYINNGIPDAINHLRNNPIFQALILPAALKEILTYYNFINNEPENVHGAQWNEFAETLITKPLDIDMTFDWIDEVVTEFAKSFELCTQVIAKIEGE